MSKEAVRKVIKAKDRGRMLYTLGSEQFTTQELINLSYDLLGFILTPNYGKDILFYRLCGLISKPHVFKSEKNVLLYSEMRR